ncbi:MAG: two-component system sensor histidine kinase NtrB [Janthinobacterium lividum]
MKQTVGLLIKDGMFRRLIEGVVVNLDLTPFVLEVGELDPVRITDFELLIADEEVARKIRPMVYEAQRIAGAEIKPALIAVVSAPYTPSADKQDSSDFDAVLAVPEKPANLTAQLSVALYAHRAFATRYQSAMEELKLNRNIFKSVTNGISVANAQLPDMPLMYVNPAFEVMTGYTLEEVEGKNCRFLQGDDREQPGLTLVREAIKQQRETIAVIRNYRKDGSFFWNELSLSPIRNAAGELTHFVGIQMDVTERVEFETALRESEKLAAVGRLASSIAHEINNPLEAVMNLVYLAEQFMPKVSDNEESRRFLRQADMELQRVKLITAQSLRFFKQSTRPEAVTCSALLAPIVDLYKPRFENFHIDVELRERSSQHVVCLASEIRQVVTNLITNAIDAMRGTGGKLLVRTRESTYWKTDARGVIITVADTGKGMSSETQASIYKAFYTTKGISGTGLGLWISSEIVHRHHGHLQVKSREGSGTVFQLFLPFQAAAGDERL